MKPWIQRALIVTALAGLIAYIAYNTYWDDVTVPAPLRGEAITNPFYAAMALSTELGAIPERRQTLGTLDDSLDVLVLSAWNWNLIRQRREAIEAWVEGGGHLLVDSTLIDDGPFSQWSDVYWHYPGDDEDEGDADESKRDESTEHDESAEPPEPSRGFDPERCGLLEEVDATLEARPQGMSFQVCTIDRFSHLDLESAIEWGLALDEQVQAARVRVGDGAVTVLNLSPFGNRNLTQLDHGELFVAATQLRRGTRIAFASEAEHASLLALIWRHGAPVVVLTLLAIAAALWRSAMRFGPLAPASDTARRSLADQIRGTGRFAIRLGDGKALHAATVRALYEAAQRRIPGFSALPRSERSAAIAQASELDEQLLASAINHAAPRRTHELAQVIALLENARRKILD